MSINKSSSSRKSDPEREHLTTSKKEPKTKNKRERRNTIDGIDEAIARELQIAEKAAIEAEQAVDNAAALSKRQQKREKRKTAKPETSKHEHEQSEEDREPHRKRSEKKAKLPEKEPEKESAEIEKDKAAKEERERLQKEKEAKEKEAKEKDALERERIDKVKAEQEAKEKAERIEKEREAKREKVEQKAADKAAKKEKDRIERDRAEKESQEKAAEKAARKAAEKADKAVIKAEKAFEKVGLEYEPISPRRESPLKHEVKVEEKEKERRKHVEKTFSMPDMKKNKITKLPEFRPSHNLKRSVTAQPLDREPDEEDIRRTNSPKRGLKVDESPIEPNCDKHELDKADAKNKTERKEEESASLSLLTQLESENRELKEKLSKLTSELEISKLQILQNSNNANNQNSEIMKSFVESKQETNSVIKELSEVQRHLLEHLTSNDSKAKDMKLKIKKLKGEVRNLQTQHFSSQNQILHLDSELRSKSGQLTKLQTDYDHLKKKLEISKTKNAELKETSNTWNDQELKYKSNLQKLRNRLEDTKAESASRIFDLETKYKLQIQTLTLDLERESARTDRYKTEAKYFKNKYQEQFVSAPSQPTPIPQTPSSPKLVRPATSSEGLSKNQQAQNDVFTHSPVILTSPRRPQSSVHPTTPLSPRRFTAPNAGLAKNPLIEPAFAKRESSPPRQIDIAIIPSSPISASVSPDPQTFPTLSLSDQTPLEVDVDFNTEPDEPPETLLSPREEEDDYARMKREYEKLMGNTLEKEIKEAPVQQTSSGYDSGTDSEDSEMDEYQKMKKQYEKLQQKAQHPSPRTQSNPSPQSPTKSPLPTVKNVPLLDDDDFERLKAQYEEETRKSIIETLTSPKGPPPNKPRLTRTDSLNRNRNSNIVSSNSRAGEALKRSETAPGEEKPNPFLKRDSQHKPSTVTVPRIDPRLSTLEITPLVPLSGEGTGVILTTPDRSQANLLEHLKGLALSGNMPTFGNNLKVVVDQTQKQNDELMFRVHIETDMRQFGHIIFDQLDVWRSHSDFEELHKKLSSNFTLPKLPKKKGSQCVEAYQELMTEMASNPDINCLSIFVDFFDPSKFSKEKESSLLGGLLGLAKKK